MLIGCFYEPIRMLENARKKLENLPEMDLLEAVFQNCKNPKMSNQVFVCYFLSAYKSELDGPPDRDGVFSGQKSTFGILESWLHGPVRIF